MTTINSRFRLLALLNLLPLVTGCHALSGPMSSKGQLGKTADLRTAQSSENSADSSRKNEDLIVAPVVKSESHRVLAAQSSSFVDPSAPNPSEVTINSFTYAGSGCGAGTVIRAGCWSSTTVLLTRR